MASEQDAVLSIIYSSAATVPFSDTDLVELLKVSRRNNAGSEVTGMLLYRDGRFLQVLEGPEEPLRALMDVLATDERHTGLRVLFEEPLRTRQFPNWTMGFQRADDSADDEPSGFRSNFDDLDRNDPTATVRALQELVRWFQKRADR